MVGANFHTSAIFFLLMKVGKLFQVKIFAVNKLYSSEIGKGLFAFVAHCCSPPSLISSHD